MTMKPSLARLKYVVGRWTRPGTTLPYIKGKILRAATEVEVPKMPMLKHVLSKSQGPTGFVVREAEEVLLLPKSGNHSRWIPFCYIFIISFFFPSFFVNITIVKMKEWKKKGRKKIMQQNLQIALLGPVSKKPALPLFGAWSLLLIHVWISPNEGYGAFETSCPLLKWARRPWIFMHSVLAFWPSIYITLFSSYQPFHLNK